MFGIFDKALNVAIGTTAAILSPVTELIGVDEKRIAALLALGWTVYEISQLTGVAEDVIESLKE